MMIGFRARMPINDNDYVEILFLKATRQSIPEPKRRTALGMGTGSALQTLTAMDTSELEMRYLSNIPPGPTRS